MKYNPIILITVSAIALSCLTGCQKNDTEVISQEKAKIVSVQNIAKKSVNETLDYIGIVKAKDTKKYSFLTGGKIEKIYISEGQFVKAGSPIAKLDTQTLEYSAAASSNSTDSANAVLQKTIETYNNKITEAENGIKTLNDTISATEISISAIEKQLDAAKSGLDAGKEALDAAYSSLSTLEDHLNKTIILHDNGIVSDNDLDTMQTQYDTQKAAYDVSLAEYDGEKAEYEAQQAAYEAKKTELRGLYTQLETANDSLNTLNASKEQDIKAAEATVSSAEISTSINNKNIDDAKITAEEDCYVISVPYKEGETVAAGYPVAVVKGKNKIVTIGVSDKDYLKITPSSKVMINDKYTGHVDTIAQYPDETTRTYNIDIAIDTDELIAGETVDIKVITGIKTGYYVPLTSVFNSEGVDYVYAVNDKNRVYKKQVNVISVDGDYANIGTEMGDNEDVSIISSGVKNINENDLVEFQR